MQRNSTALHSGSGLKTPQQQRTPEPTSPLNDIVRKQTMPAIGRKRRADTKTVPKLCRTGKMKKKLKNYLYLTNF